MTFEGKRVYLYVTFFRPLPSWRRSVLRTLRFNNGDDSENVTETLTLRSFILFRVYSNSSSLAKVRKLSWS